MEYLKEEGSLDVERINKLPIEEYMDIVGSLTEEQYNEYMSKLPIIETYELAHPMMVDSLELELNRGCVIADDYLSIIKERMINTNG